MLIAVTLLSVIRTELYWIDNGEAGSSNNKETYSKSDILFDGCQEVPKFVEESQNKKMRETPIKQFQFKDQ